MKLFKPVSIFAFLSTLGSLFAAPSEIKLTRVYENLKLNRPVQLVIPPDGTNRRFFVQQTGEVFILPKDENGTETKTFLSVSDRKMVTHDFEEGLLNLSFHPDYKTNGKFYIYYSQQNPKRSVISEMQVSKTDPDKADLSTERIIMELPQPFWNHNSGNMAFGPDGFLYICFGDGGKGNDPHNLSQNRWILNGKMLRIDVNSKTGSLPYGIPADNPFVEEKGTRPEIYALGLRNPWGIYFEPDTENLWCADVGQALWEEVNLITKGGNYGWNYREGAHRFEMRKDDPADDLKMIDPIHEYPHTDGISITGGVVYNGAKVSDLKGWYVYADWGSGHIWALRQEDGKKADNVKIFPGNPGKCKPTAFCHDENGEVLVLSWGGEVYRIDQ